MSPSQWLNFDALGVLVFVVIGRNQHDEPDAVAGVLRTAAPFLIALFLGWALAKAWRQPDSMRTGVITWTTTLVVGMVLRRLFWDKGTAASFVVVAAVFLALTMFSWRVVSRSIHRRFAVTPSDHDDPGLPPTQL
jgi:hypothetical protein